MFNPGLLKLELLCRGMHIDSSCDIDREGRGLARIRAGLGSGVELVLPDDLYCNVPVLEDFVKLSPLTLALQDGAYVILRDGEIEGEVRLAPRPKWYDRRTKSGRLMSEVGGLQGTTLSFYSTEVCGFWNMKPRMNCRFCATGLNVTNASRPTVDEVVEVCQAAREEGTTFCHFNGGYFGENGLNRMLPYVAEVKARTHLLVGVQMPPERDLTNYDSLIDAGTDHFSFCYEFHDPEVFATLCPGKNQKLGQQRFYDAIEYTSRRMGRGRNSGEIIAGLEPIENTMASIDHIVSMGAFPTVCVFRPVIGTDLADRPTPPFEDMVRVFRHMYEACRDQRIPTGIAPNVKTRLVVLPYEGRYFRESFGLSDALYGARLAAMRTLFRTFFRMRMIRG